jgi:hypothetical protein
VEEPLEPLIQMAVDRMTRSLDSFR